ADRPGRPAASAARASDLLGPRAAAESESRPRDGDHCHLAALDRLPEQRRRPEARADPLRQPLHERLLRLHRAPPRRRFAPAYSGATARDCPWFLARWGTAFVTKGVTLRPPARPKTAGSRRAPGAATRQNRLGRCR